jgi:hypothetical protein
MSEFIRLLLGRPPDFVRFGGSRRFEIIRRAFHVFLCAVRRILSILVFVHNFSSQSLDLVTPCCVSTTDFLRCTWKNQGS